MIFELSVLKDLSSIKVQMSLEMTAWYCNMNTGLICYLNILNMLCVKEIALSFWNS